MKKKNNLWDAFYIIMIYIITTIISLLCASLLIKHEYIQSDLKNYLWVLIIFTVSFLMLIRLLKVKYKSVLIFLGIIMLLLVFVLLNLDMITSRWSTPDSGIFPIIGFVSIFLTIPFQSVINFLVGYGVGNLSYIIVPLYMLVLSVLSYFSLTFKNKN